jgi:hypothetical protein
VGTVVHLTPGSRSCNIQIAHVEVEDLPADFKAPPYPLFHQRGVLASPCPDLGRANMVGATAGLGFGQCDAFELVYRAEAAA